MVDGPTSPLWIPLFFQESSYHIALDTLSADFTLRKVQTATPFRCLEMPGAVFFEAINAVSKESQQQISRELEDHVDDCIRSLGQACGMVLVVVVPVVIVVLMLVVVVVVLVLKLWWCCWWWWWWVLMVLVPVTGGGGG